MRGWAGRMGYRLMASANLMFGIVPATFLLFWIVFFMLAALVSLPSALMSLPDHKNITIALWKGTELFLAGTAAVIGYAALRSAVKGVKTPRVLFGLVLGIAANLYAIHMILDLNPNAMRDWVDWYWGGSPIVVASAHVATYFVRALRDRVRKPAAGGTS